MIESSIVLKHIVSFARRARSRVPAHRVVAVAALVVGSALVAACHKSTIVVARSTDTFVCDGSRDCMQDVGVLIGKERTPLGTFVANANAATLERLKKEPCVVTVPNEELVFRRTADATPPTRANWRLPPSVPARFTADGIVIENGGGNGDFLRGAPAAEGRTYSYLVSPTGSKTRWKYTVNVEILVGSEVVSCKGDPSITNEM